MKRRKPPQTGALCRLTNVGVFDVGQNIPMTVWKDTDRFDEIRFSNGDVFLVTGETFVDEQPPLSATLAMNTYYFVVSYACVGWIEEDNIILL